MGHKQKISRQEDRKIIMNKAMQYGGLFLIIWLSFLVTYRSSENTINLTGTVQGFMKLAIGSTIFIGSFLLTQKKDKKDKEEILLKSIIILGLIMRIGYMLYTPCTVRQHDLGELSIQGMGHAGYILHILEGRLPTNNYVQYYHPPLFHFLAAGVMKMTKPFLMDNSIERLLEATKIVSCYASCLVLLMTGKIGDALKLKKRTTLIVVTQIAFLPNFYLLSGRVNNDVLAIFFMVLIILYTIKWYESPNTSYITIVALGFGLGMMTKMSVGIIALFTGSIMVIKWIELFRISKVISLLKQYVLFGIVAFPLGLWYPIRNYIYFRQPLMYVYDIKDRGEYYCGDLSFFQRFIKLELSHLLSPVYNNPQQDKSALIYLLKGALFGEFGMGQEKIAQLLIIIYFILCIVTLWAVGYFILNYRGKLVWRIGLPSLWALFYILYIGFNLRYPYSCTLDYRYIVPTALLGAIFVGATDELVGEKEQGILKKYYSKGLIGGLGIFSLLSTMMYCSI